MYKLIKTQYLNTGRSSSMTEYESLKDAKAQLHYEAWYAYNQGFDAHLQILGENGENIRNERVDGAEERGEDL